MITTELSASHEWAQAFWHWRGPIRDAPCDDRVTNGGGARWPRSFGGSRGPTSPSWAFRLSEWPTLLQQPDGLHDQQRLPAQGLPARRCFSLDWALRKAVESSDSDQRVAILASGGLGHFMIGEELGTH